MRSKRPGRNGDKENSGGIPLNISGPTTAGPSGSGRTPLNGFNGGSGPRSPLCRSTTRMNRDIRAELRAVRSGEVQRKNTHEAKEKGSKEETEQVEVEDIPVDIEDGDAEESEEPLYDQRPSLRTHLRTKKLREDNDELDSPVSMFSKRPKSKVPNNEWERVPYTHDDFRPSRRLHEHFGLEPDDRAATYLVAEEEKLYNQLCLIPPDLESNPYIQRAKHCFDEVRLDVLNLLRTEEKYQNCGYALLFCEFACFSSMRDGQNGACLYLMSDCEHLKKLLHDVRGIVSGYAYGRHLDVIVQRGTPTLYGMRNAGRKIRNRMSALLGRRPRFEAVFEDFGEVFENAPEVRGFNASLYNHAPSSIARSTGGRLSSEAEEHFEDGASLSDRETTAEYTSIHNDAKEYDTEVDIKALSANDPEHVEYTPYDVYDDIDDVLADPDASMFVHFPAGDDGSVFDSDHDNDLVYPAEDEDDDAAPEVTIRSGNDAHISSNESLFEFPRAGLPFEIYDENEENEPLEFPTPAYVPSGYSDKENIPPPQTPPSRTVRPNSSPPSLRAHITTLRKGSLQEPSLLKQPKATATATKKATKSEANYFTEFRDSIIKTDRYCSYNRIDRGFHYGLRYISHLPVPSSTEGVLTDYHKRPNIGESISHGDDDDSCGTLGGYLVDDETGEQYVLTAFHVVNTDVELSRPVIDGVKNRQRVVAPAIVDFQSNLDGVEHHRLGITGEFYRSVDYRDKATASELKKELIKIEDDIEKYREAKTIYFGEIVASAWRNRRRVNDERCLIDLALIRPDPGRIGRNTFTYLGPDNAHAARYRLEADGWAKPTLGAKVLKVGRSTGLTKGTIISSNADVRLHVSNDDKETTGTGRVHQYYWEVQCQIATAGSEPWFSQSGDSGAFILKAPTRKGMANWEEQMPLVPVPAPVVGLLFGGADSVEGVHLTFFNSSAVVREELKRMTGRDLTPGTYVAGSEWDSREFVRHNKIAPIPGLKADESEGRWAVDHPYRNTNSLRQATKEVPSPHLKTVRKPTEPKSGQEKKVIDEPSERNGSNPDRKHTLSPRPPTPIARKAKGNTLATKHPAGNKAAEPSVGKASTSKDAISGKMILLPEKLPATQKTTKPAISKRKATQPDCTTGKNTRSGGAQQKKAIDTSITSAGVTAAKSTKIPLPSRRQVPLSSQSPAVSDDDTPISKRTRSQTSLASGYRQV